MRGLQLPKILYKIVILSSLEIVAYPKDPCGHLSSLIDNALHEKRSGYTRLAVIYLQNNCVHSSGYPWHTIKQHSASAAVNERETTTIKQDQCDLQTDEHANVNHFSFNNIEDKINKLVQISCYYYYCCKYCANLKESIKHKLIKKNYI